MTRSRLVQIVAGATPGDAITGEALAIFETATATRSIRSQRLFADHIAPGMARRFRPLASYRVRPDDVVVVHYGTRIRGLERVLDDSPRLALVYHNITPPDFYRPYNLRIAAELELSRRMLGRLVRQSTAVVAHSKFSAAELRSVGAEVVQVRALATEPGHPLRDYAGPDRGRPPESLPDRKGNGAGRFELFTANSDRAPISRPTLLFVGRIVPNKGHATLIKALFLLRKIWPEARLVLAGHTVAGLELYEATLRRLARYLGVEHAVRFTGSLTSQELALAYREADVFVCASEHEGFCLPLLEAMLHGLPLVAAGARPSAIAETAEGAALLLRSGSAMSLAAAVSRLIRDPRLRAAVIAAQDRRLQRYVNAAPANELLAAILRPFLETSP